MAVLIKPDGTTEIVDGKGKKKRGKDFLMLTSEQINEAVGGYFQIAPMVVRGLVKIGDILIDISPRHIMWCNEEGKLQGLPVNPIATDLCDNMDIIVGTVLITDPGETE